MGKLFVVATPIGNLQDITHRALKILKKVDLILAEDTRTTKKLLDFYNIKTPLLSYHHHSKLQRIKYILHLLKRERNIALVSEAGTPGISDPGNELIKKIVQEFGNEVQIIPVPGPSSITALASIAHFSMQKFLFLGFLPKKKKQKIIKEILSSGYPTIFFESPKRIVKTLEIFLSFNPEAEIIIGKELTKRFEKIFRGKIKEVFCLLKKSKIKGEFTVIVKPQKNAEK